MTPQDMKITFLYMGAESPAIEYLSSSLKKRGHQTSLVFDPALFDDKQYLSIPFLARLFNARKQLVERVAAEKPDLVAFSAGTDIYLWAKELARQIKKKISVPIIFGGIHATAVPERVLDNDFVDMVCLGEGDEALVELADSFAAGKLDYGIKNIWFKKDGRLIRNPVRDLLQDLDKLPLPDKELFASDIPIAKGKYMLMTSRGCPYKCSYCYNDVLKDFYAGKGKFVRQRSVDNVMHELKVMKQKYDYSSVAFMDDLFVGNRKWFGEFIPRYKAEIARPYSCMTSANVIDEEMVRALKDSGCTRLQFGIQTMHEPTRNDILGRNFETTAHIKRAIAACDKLGVSYSLDHIFAIPGEGVTEYESTAEFFTGTRADRLCCYSLFYYPGTRIIASAKERGMLTDRDISDIEEGRGKLYVYGSSLKKDDLRVFKALRKLYSLAPLMPKKFNRYLVRSGQYKLLRFLPRLAALICESISALATRHPRAKDYLRYYWMHICRRGGFKTRPCIGMMNDGIRTTR